MKRILAGYKNFLLLLVLVVLWLPLLQNKFRFADVKPLHGYVVLPKEDSLTTDKWFSGEYQLRQDSVLNVAFGFRNTCVRLNHQVAYALFNETKANQVIVGKQSYLYEIPYIDAYMGADFIGTDSVDHIVQRLKFISDTLNTLNKKLLLVFAAGKASFYPEFIPDKYKPVKVNTNYKALSKATSSAGLNVIDFNSWFVKQKARAKYPLYPQYGIHWSKYGTVLAADSIIKTIENLQHIQMPHLYYDSLRLEQPHGIDYDIGDGMNLLFRLKSFDMAYMNVMFEKDSTKRRPAVLTISDSFYWGMYDFGISKSFKNDHFWYYNKMVYPEAFKEETLTDFLDIGTEIRNHDVIMIMATEATLKDFGWKFIDKAYAYFKKPEPPHSEKYYQRLKQLYKYIQTDKKWMADIIKRAEEKNVQLNDQILDEARWVLGNDGLY